MIMHYINSLDSLHYCIDVFDVNTGIWWHCDDDESTQIGEFPEGVYIRICCFQAFGQWDNPNAVVNHSNFIPLYHALPALHKSRMMI